MELIPYGADILKVIWEINNDRHELFASSCVGGQFADLIQALYALYSEGYDTHSHFRHRHGVHCAFFFPQADSTLKENEVRATSEFCWNGEGPLYEISFNRKCKEWNYPITNGKDPVIVKIRSYSKKKTSKTYHVEGRDLCYAAAKAYTRALKEYGVYGYYSTTGGNSNGYGDVVELHWLLFLKAYALNALEVRELKAIWKDGNRKPAEGTDFQKELELLLFSFCEAVQKVIF